MPLAEKTLALKAIQDLKALQARRVHKASKEWLVHRGKPELKDRRDLKAPR